MVKDKFIKIFNETKKNSVRVFNFCSKALDFLVHRIHLIDPKENTKQRVVSAIVLIPIALYAIFYSKSVFIFMAVAITIIMTAEWIDMIRASHDQKKWRLIGLFYILIPVYSVIKLRLQNTDTLFWMFSIIWATDIFAFFAGKIIGGQKLAPKISPNKTWSGLIGGIFASMLIGFISAFIFDGSVLFFVFISALIAVVEQLSDLLESKFKRTFGVKDSGNIIPGHGGVLDRLDGMMLVAPLVLFLTTIFSSQFGG
jgi:phosphatidate cytidylyltransferase